MIVQMYSNFLFNFVWLWQFERLLSGMKNNTADWTLMKKYPQIKNSPQPNS